MLPYSTPVHAAFRHDWASHLDAGGAEYRFPAERPVPGEQRVLKSFSTEWLDYNYDGVIWESTYQDHKARVLKEVGPAIRDCQWFLEIGCGLGLATGAAQESSLGDAVGVDLSLAVARASREFRSNPFMHFVQASAFSLPLRDSFFDVIYSRGVLHHTYSTRAAFEHVSRHCRKGGTLYVWLYGRGSINSSPLRIALFGLEAVTRPMVSRAPDSLAARVFLGAAALGYMAFNRLRRLFTPDTQPLNFLRGLHAARDRFTPRFAHRHSRKEVESWFITSGFEAVQVINWQDMPASEQEDFRRNIGVRGLRGA
jgi:SAM-dependent methyltransferase